MSVRGRPAVHGLGEGAELGGGHATVPTRIGLRERVLEPLRMVDTGFSVPPDQRARIVEMTSTDETGRLVAAGADVNPRGEMLKRYPSGAGGLYSTAGDYARFCRMLLNAGELDGIRILRRRTVELMMTNHLAQLSPPVGEWRAEASSPASARYSSTCSGR